MSTQRKRFLLVAASALFAIAAADVGLRFLTDNGWFLGLRVPPFGLQTSEARQSHIKSALARLEKNSKPAVRGGFHPRYGWVNRRGKYLADGVEQHINSLGARGSREYEDAPSPDILRIGCFGESFTFGTEVLDGDDWPAQLESMQQSLEVINLGNPGWGTDQALLLWRDIGKKIHANHVFIGLLLENIRRNVNRYRAFAYPETEPPIVKPRFRVVEGALVHVAIPFESHQELLRAALTGELREIVLDGDWWARSDPVPSWSGIARAYSTIAHERRRDPARLWNDTDGEPYLVTMRLLSQFHAEVLEDGVPSATVLIFPDKKDLVRARENRAYWSGLKAELRRREIPFLDLTEALLAAGDADDLYLDVHLSPKGNRAVAEFLAPWIEDHLRDGPR